tara:strand:+ start:1017 stop:1253 length:237 start_codon:yes stop_codon:yes gene_type:complete
MNKKKGDLVFIPSSVRLVQFSKQDAIDGGLFAEKYKITSRPKNVIFMGQYAHHYEVLYDGERWHASKEDVYEGVRDGC